MKWKIKRRKWKVKWTLAFVVDRALRNFWERAGVDWGKTLKLKTPKPKP